MADTQCPKPGHNGWLGKCLECARDEDFSPFGDATTPGFFLKPLTPAAPETASTLHSEGDEMPKVCPACESATRKFVYKGWGDETYARNYFACRHPWHAENKPAFVETAKVRAETPRKEEA